MRTLELATNKNVRVLVTWGGSEWWVLEFNLEIEKSEIRNQENKTRAPFGIVEIEPHDTAFSMLEEKIMNYSLQHHQSTIPFLFIIASLSSYCIEISAARKKQQLLAASIRIDHQVKNTSSFNNSQKCRGNDPIANRQILIPMTKVARVSAQIVVSLSKKMLSLVPLNLWKVPVGLRVWSVSSSVRHRKRHLQHLEVEEGTDFPEIVAKRR